MLISGGYNQKFNVKLIMLISEGMIRNLMFN